MDAGVLILETIMARKHLTLIVQPARLGICRLDPANPIPGWVFTSSFFSVTRTLDELSVVCDETLIPEGQRCHKGWRSIKVKGPLDLSETGILSSLAAPLAGKDISVFSVSTHDTDYLLVKESDLLNTIDVFSLQGHRVFYADSP
jgi:hypothetical protein